MEERDNLAATFTEMLVSSIPARLQVVTETNGERIIRVFVLVLGHFRTYSCRFLVYLYLLFAKLLGSIGKITSEDVLLKISINVAFRILRQILNKLTDEDK